MEAAPDKQNDGATKDQCNRKGKQERNDRSSYVRSKEQF